MPTMLDYSDQSRFIEDPFHPGLGDFRRGVVPAADHRRGVDTLGVLADPRRVVDCLAGGAPGVDAVRSAIRLVAADHFHHVADQRTRPPGAEPTFQLKKRPGKPGQIRRRCFSG